MESGKDQKAGEELGWGEGGGESLFASLLPKPKPKAAVQPAPTPVPKPQPAAPPPPPPPAPAQLKSQPLHPAAAPKPDHPEGPSLDAKLAALEKRLLEAAAKAAPQGGDQQALSYLKQKVSELETKLAEAQEKALSFAYELKGRDEARKESQREMEELLSVVRKNQAEAEAQRADAAERAHARERIEALEKLIMELSSRPAPAPPPELAALGAKMEELASRLAAMDNTALIKETAQELRALARKVDQEFPSAVRAMDARISRVEAGISEELKRIIPMGVLPLLRELEEKVLTSAKGLTLRLFQEEALSPVRPEEAEKLDRLVRGCVREAFGPLASALESRINENVRAYTETHLDAGISALEKRSSEVSEAARLVAGVEEALTRFMAGHLARVRETIAKAPPAPRPGGSADGYEMGYLLASLQGLERSLSGAIEAAAGPATGTPESDARGEAAELAVALKKLLAGLDAHRQEDKGKG